MTLTAGGQATAMTPTLASIAPDPERHFPLGPLVDTNVHLGVWPFRYLADSDPQKLTAKLKRLGFTQAWTSSFDGLLHRDIRAVNERLVAACQGNDGLALVPFGVLNPNLPDWEEDLRRCHEVHRMPGVRIYPSYHDYSLQAPFLQPLLNQIERRGLLLQLVVSLEDTRTQHPRMRTDDVDLSALPDLLTRFPALRVQLLGCRPTGPIFSRLANESRVRFDTARIEATDGIAGWVRRTSPERVLLGTHSPFLITVANLIKLYESDLNDQELRLVAGTAATAWLANHPN